MIEIGVHIDDSKNPEYDASNWKFDWVITCSFFVAVGVIEIIAGVGLFFLRRWAAILLLIFSSINLLLDCTLYFGEIYKYAFQRADIYDLLLSIGLAALTWTILTRSASKKILLKI